MTETRHASTADAETLVELIRSAYRGEESRYGWTSEADLVEGDRISEEQVRSVIGNPNSVMLVVEAGERLLACCQLEDRGGGLAYFGTFAVTPLQQGRGLGRHLLREAERWAVESFHSVAMEMTVLAQQEKLISWYERRGFTRTGELRPFPADSTFARPLRDDLYFVVFSKKLDPSARRRGLR